MSNLKILASHPIQYQVPFFRAMLDAGLDIEVAFYQPGTAGKKAYDAQFGIEINWDIDLLSGYPHQIFVKEQATYQRGEQAKIAPQLLSWALRDPKTPLLIFGWFAEIVWLAWSLRTLRGLPTLTISETTMAGFAATSKPAWRVSLLRWLLRHVSAALYIGSRNREFLTHMGVSSQKLFPTPYSVDKVYFESEIQRLMPQRRQLCLQYGLDPDKPTFLFCGKLYSLKRNIELLEAYQAAGLQDKAQLIYVGEGQLRPELERRIQQAGLKYVHLLGFFNTSQMPLAYVLGEVLCLISESETWGLVVNEALACGRPVIVTDTVGCSPDVVSPANGWVIPIDKLTKTLLEAFQQREAWPKMGAVGRAKISHHTFASMANGVKSALQMIKQS